MVSWSGHRVKCCLHARVYLPVSGLTQGCFHPMTVDLNYLCRFFQNVIVLWNDLSLQGNLQDLNNGISNDGSQGQSLDFLPSFQKNWDNDSSFSFKSTWACFPAFPLLFKYFFAFVQYFVSITLFYFWSILVFHLWFSSLVILSFLVYAQKLNRSLLCGRFFFTPREFWKQQVPLQRLFYWSLDLYPQLLILGSHS